ncbi:MAG TPA: HupE/UreJ family protein, partial [Gammaproteobacteria bacterium]|nr:HupE/UreJ family protein [Gammaproteobacteria bacterium]
MRLKIIGRLLMATVGVLLAMPVSAHNPSDSYLTLDVAPDSNVIEGRWDIALRDLDYAIGLDADGNGALTWGEVRQRHNAIAAYALSHLSVTNAGQTCTLNPVRQAVAEHTGENYTALQFQAQCENPIKKLAVDYSLFFNLDPTHRGLLRVDADNEIYRDVLSPSDSVWQLQTAIDSPWNSFVNFLWQGVWHIWIGYDHIAFLLLLLLPAVLERRNGYWQAKPGLKPALWEVAAIVTSFTVAHSITLTLAALNIV